MIMASSDDLEATNTSIKSFLSRFNPFAISEDIEESPVAGSAGSASEKKHIDALELSQTSLQLNRLERQTNQATLIDQMFAARKAQEDDDKLKDPKAKLKFTPNITPLHPEWVKWKSTIHQRLAQETVGDILDSDFDEKWQTPLLLPQIENNTILTLQERNAEDYKVLLSAKGIFHGEGDNLSTKLTMLHFGLPIAPLTMNNILQAGKDIQGTDAEDDPEDTPRVERILYAEKPLEFLDSYHERSYGYPILRRVKPERRALFANAAAQRATAANSSAQVSSALSTQDQSNSNPIPFEPSEILVPHRVGAEQLHLRGGSGEVSDLSPQYNQPENSLDNKFVPDFIAEKIPDTSDIHDQSATVGSVPALGTNYFSQIAADPPEQNFNKERIVRRIMAPAKRQKFDPWIAEQNRQDRLQRESYIKPQSVIEPGRQPEAPVFGPSKELAFTLGSSMPIIYTQRITTTDVEQILDENQYLRNHVLERTALCNICSANFQGFKKDDIKYHFRKHSDQIAWAGKCALCSDDEWVFMNSEQCREHLLSHQKQHETQKIQEFWADLECPVCELRLDNLNTGAILAHMTDHTPSVLQFCDLCGLHMPECLETELQYHKKKCVLGPQRAPGEKVPFYCEHCGADRAAQTDEASQKHRRSCPGKNNDQYFHITCGFQLSLLSFQDAHKHVQRCKAPGGFSKKFCRKCGQNLHIMDTTKMAHHKIGCSGQSPEISKDRERIENLQQLQAKTRKDSARRHWEMNWLKKEQTKLREEHVKLVRKSRFVDAQKQLIRDWSERNDETVPRKWKELMDEIGVTLSSCPFKGCEQQCKDLSREEIWHHMEEHSQTNVIFNCPLEDCNKKITIADNNMSEVLNHFRHVNSDDPDSIESARLLNQRREQLEGRQKTPAASVGGIRLDARREGLATTWGVGFDLQPGTQHHRRHADSPSEQISVERPFSLSTSSRLENSLPDVSPRLTSFGFDHSNSQSVNARSSVDLSIAPSNTPPKDHRSFAKVLLPSTGSASGKEKSASLDKHSGSPGIHNSASTPTPISTENLPRKNAHVQAETPDLGKKRKLSTLELAPESRMTGQGPKKKSKKTKKPRLPKDSNYVHRESSSSDELTQEVIGESRVPKKKRKLRFPQDPNYVYQEPQDPYELLEEVREESLSPDGLLEEARNRRPDPKKMRNLQDPNYVYQGPKSLGELKEENREAPSASKVMKKPQDKTAEELHPESIIPEAEIANVIPSSKDIDEPIQQISSTKKPKKGRKGADFGDAAYRSTEPEASAGERPPLRRSLRNKQKRVLT